MFNKKYVRGLILIGLLLFFSAAAFLFFQNNPEKEGKSSWGNEIRKIMIGENIFQAEIVATPAKRSQGLSGREDLCGECAMLFLFSEKGRLSFWMKGMKFDLDMIWIDGNEIVHIAKNVSRKNELERVNPEVRADKVLEINAGLADKLGIKVGDRAEF